MDALAREALLMRVSDKVESRARVLYALAVGLLLLAAYPVYAIGGLGRAVGLAVALTLATALAAFGALAQSQGRASVRELREYLARPSECWDWSVGTEQWADSAFEHNVGRVTEALTWPVRGAVGGAAIYAMALLITGEGGREGLVRFGALGFVLALLLSVGELVCLRWPQAHEVQVVVTPGGICVVDTYHSFKVAGEVAETVNLRETAGGLELVVGLVSTLWPIPSRREIAAPIPDEISGEAMVALGGITEVWGLLERAPHSGDAMPTC